MDRLRARLPHLLSLWALTAVAEGVMYYFFLSRPYFRDFFMPFALVLLVAAGVATWRLVRLRTGGDRRHGERRVHERRVGE
jgi:hypothetical protein